MLLSIEEEAAACREAFKGSKVGDIVIHCHHDKLFEFLTELAEERILYILLHKSKHERALRLRLFRPLNMAVINSIPELNAACAQWDAARANWKAACAQRDAACAQWKAACAQRDAARAKWDAARAKWNAARAKWNAAYAKWDAAYAKWDAAYAKWDVAYANWKAACARWDAACAQCHAELCCPECTWNGEEIIFQKDE